MSSANAGHRGVQGGICRPRAHPMPGCDLSAGDPPITVDSPDQDHCPVTEPPSSGSLGPHSGSRTHTWRRIRGHMSGQGPGVLSYETYVRIVVHDPAALDRCRSMFTAARPRGWNRTNHDESRERQGPGTGPGDLGDRWQNRYLSRRGRRDPGRAYRLLLAFAYPTAGRSLA
jgi:hypothetical protein